MKQLIVEGENIKEEISSMKGVYHFSVDKILDNRKSYQMDYANSDEALREIMYDLEEGADIVIIKPALSYLDVIQRVKDNFNVPIAAYNVRGILYFWNHNSIDSFIDSNKCDYYPIAS